MTGERVTENEKEVGRNGGRNKIRKREGRKEVREGVREGRRKEGEKESKERWKLSLLVPISRYGVWLNFLKKVTQVILEHS